jgi:hypothetical protein
MVSLKSSDGHSISREPIWQGIALFSSGFTNSGFLVSHLVPNRAGTGASLQNAITERKIILMITNEPVLRTD